MRHRAKTSSQAGRAALLIIDMINRFDFPGGHLLAHQAEDIAGNIRRLRSLQLRKRWRVIYCNDNFGRWRSDFRAVVESCVRDRTASKIATLLRPEKDDYFILKPKHSAFYSTALDLLLRSQRIRRLILCGIAGDGCVQATAIDAHMRDYEVLIAADATASLTPARNKRFLQTLASSGVARPLSTATLMRR